MYKVRFHLAKGEHFMHWQIKNVRTKEVTYINPLTHDIRMTGCRLVNQKATAQKIYEGANKTVCAWIECKALTVLESHRTIPNPFHGNTVYYKDKELKYNPRISPSWIVSMGYRNDGVGYRNGDGMTFPLIKTMGRELFGNVEGI